MVWEVNSIGQIHVSQNVFLVIFIIVICIARYHSHKRAVMGSKLMASKNAGVKNAGDSTELIDLTPVAKLV